jgi:hypothetical protein
MENYQKDLNSINNVYTVLVAGNVDLTKYDLTRKVEPYVVYEYKNRSNIKKQSIDFYEKLINRLEKDPTHALVCQMLQIKLQDIQEMTDEEHFESISQGMIFNKETGDALTTINPNGKYKTLSEPTTNSALPLCKDTFKCLVNDIPEKIKNDELIEKYSQQWDDIIGGSNLNKKEFVKLYGNKETYINVMTEPLFYNAFVSNETGWLEQGDENQIEWVLTFRERFINSLPQNTQLKVYNFTR